MAAKLSEFHNRRLSERHEREKRKWCELNTWLQKREIWDKPRALNRAYFYVKCNTHFIILPVSHKISLSPSLAFFLFSRTFTHLSSPSSVSDGVSVCCGSDFMLCCLHELHICVQTHCEHVCVRVCRRKTTHLICYCDGDKKGIIIQSLLMHVCMMWKMEKLCVCVCEYVMTKPIAPLQSDWW